jgi:predicted transcriptional regulator
MRLAGIEHTYQEPLENVKGLFGLLELGLSDEAYLKLHNFKVKEEIGTPKFFTLYDLLTLKVKEPSWIIPNLLPEGFSILGGKPKVGKSWLGLQIALTCVQLGKRVVYFALEDTKGRLQKRLKHLGIIDPEALKDLPILFSFELPKIGKGAIKEIRACIQEFKPDLIIIDPWAKIKPQTKGKDLYLEEYQALDTFKGFLKDGVNILLVHHTRKSPSEDPLDEILGSTGQTAVVDNVLVLKRGRGSQTAVLHLIPRDFEGADLGLRFENGWKIEGKAEEVMLGEGQKEVLEAIKKLEEMGEKATIKAIAELTGKSSGVIRFLLYKLIQKGLIERSQRGTYSFCKSIKSANNANNANNANMLTMLTNQPQPSFVSFVSDTPNKPLTILSKENQGFGDFVSDVSDVSDVNINCYSTHSTPDLTPTQPPTPTQREEDQEEEVIYLLMPEQDKCSICGCEVYQVEKRIYEKGMGVGSCARCGHVSLFGDFGKGRVLEPAGVEFWLTDFADCDGSRR